MNRIRDALELLTAQHEQIDDLFEQVRQIGDEDALVELADKLTTHLALEQLLFYPAIRAQVTSDVMTELLAEHAAVKEVLADLVCLGTRDDDFLPTLARLGTLLVGHSSWQEEELFTAAAETMSCAELAALCDRFYKLDAIAIAA
jgi:hypothetical protein